MVYRRQLTYWKSEIITGLHYRKPTAAIEVWCAASLRQCKTSNTRASECRMTDYKWEKLPQPACSPDLNPPDYDIFPKMKNPLFSMLKDLNTAETQRIRDLNFKEESSNIQKLPQRWEAVVTRQGDYFLTILIYMSDYLKCRNDTLEFSGSLNGNWERVGLRKPSKSYLHLCSGRNVRPLLIKEWNFICRCFDAIRHNGNVSENKRQPFDSGGLEITVDLRESHLVALLFTEFRCNTVYPIRNELYFARSLAVRFPNLSHKVNKQESFQVAGILPARVRCNPRIRVYEFRGYSRRGLTELQWSCCVTSSSYQIHEFDLNSVDLDPSRPYRQDVKRQAGFPGRYATSDDATSKRQDFSYSEKIIRHTSTFCDSRARPWKTKQMKRSIVRVTDTALTSLSFSVDGIGNSEMRTRIRHRLSDIRLSVGKTSE
ncbi:hypothetical protein ANN_21011 [Periplaneta americana]|uniref:Uncharacterized protein n=1 Tax=Periplaneta americana TaxID=6978 RepID=A0ABQ8SFC0_PERAM|nr:hypothetical protein ANN_21011 [Periplaneta americana]